MLSERNVDCIGLERSEALTGTSTVSCMLLCWVGRMGETGLKRSQLKVLVTGASGYVGGRLVPALLAAGCEVRCLARTPAKLDDAPWRDRVEVVGGSVGDDLTQALSGVDVAAYLVHSIGEGRDWAVTERARCLQIRPPFRSSRVASHGLSRGFGEG